MRRVVVIGAGLGGLAAAIHLARGGYAVTVVERLERVGGKMSRYSAGGFTFDTGPTLLTMPFILDELVAGAGEEVARKLAPVRLDPICRYFFPDNTTLDAGGDPASMEAAIARLHPRDGAGFRRFMDHAAAIYRAAAGPFLFSSFGSLGLKGFAANLRHVPALARIDAFRTLDAAVRQHFQDPRLQQIFNRFATYNGSSPYLAPATLALIPYVEFQMGGWYLRGGMYTLAETLSALASRLGVEILTGRGARSVVVTGKKARGIVLEDGTRMEADAVVCNADALYAHEVLLREVIPKSPRYGKAGASLAGLVMLLGVRGTFPALAQHNVFFSSDYREEFATLIERECPSLDPTVYVSISSKVDPEHAPPGNYSNLFLLVNAPPVGERFDWDREVDTYRQHVLATLARRGLRIERKDICVEHTITPRGFERLFNAHRGALYGPSSNSRMAAFLRPPNRSRDVRRLYFAGGSSHPGGGIPLVLLSGKHVARLIAEDVA